MAVNVGWKKVLSFNFIVLTKASVGEFVSGKYQRILTNY